MWDLCPLSDHRVHQEDLFNLAIHCRKKMQTMNILRMLIVLVHICVGTATPFSSSTRSAATSIGQEHMCACSWWRCSMSHLEYERANWISNIFTIVQRTETHLFYAACWEYYLPSRSHGKDEFFQAIQILVPQFRLLGKKKNRKEEETLCLSCKKKETAKTETIQKKKCFFWKGRSVCKKEKRKKAEKGKSKPRESPKKRDTFKKYN